MSRFNVSRFADPNRTDVLVLGECQCPGTPHEQDEVVYRLELGAGEEERAGTYGWSSTGWAYFDSAAARAKLVEIGVVRWNLLGPDGEPMPVTARSATLLDEATLDLITKKLDEVTGRDEPDEKGKPKRKPPPNASGARSGRTSSASASRTRQPTRTRR